MRNFEKKKTALFWTETFNLWFYWQPKHFKGSILFWRVFIQPKFLPTQRFHKCWLWNCGRKYRHPFIWIKLETENSNFFFGSIKVRRINNTKLIKSPITKNKRKNNLEWQPTHSQKCLQKLMIVWLACRQNNTALTCDGEGNSGEENNNAQHLELLPKKSFLLKNR